LHRELLVLRQSGVDDRVDEDRVEVPRVADPGTQSPQRLGRARLLSHHIRLIRTAPGSANLAVADLPHALSFAVTGRAGKHRAPQHTLWGSAVCGQSGCRSRIT